MTTTITSMKIIEYMISPLCVFATGPFGSKTAMLLHPLTNAAILNIPVNKSSLKRFANIIPHFLIF